MRPLSAAKEVAAASVALLVHVDGDGEAAVPGGAAATDGAAEAAVPDRSAMVEVRLPLSPASLRLQS
ncbi:MAG: hypothetical protein ACK4ZJ_18785, partial [Allorhizobium sp.]